MELNLVELLESLTKRPEMHVCPVSYATVKSYLAGLQIGLKLSGFEYTWDDYNEAAKARGWDPRGNIGILRDFTRKGLSDEDMSRELIAVETGAYSLALGRNRAKRATRSGD